MERRAKFERSIAVSKKIGTAEFPTYVVVSTATFKFIFGDVDIFADRAAFVNIPFIKEN